MAPLWPDFPKFSSFMKKVLALSAFLSCAIAAMAESSFIDSTFSANSVAITSIGGFFDEIYSVVCQPTESVSSSFEVTR